MCTIYASDFMRQDYLATIHPEMQFLSQITVLHILITLPCQSTPSGAGERVGLFHRDPSIAFVVGSGRTIYMCLEHILFTPNLSSSGKIHWPA
ncbi:uncharacterized protein ARMOST_15290 [Armillaria ostoyae]|uniref:Uncharacterized protein n=1 Tax=Armillaria ostoyae TaxID=47428 RepID=A0A284RT00_ARMOS|nr:uncharacterized protein ARMOST_15290 [Armillaria ostoyae]